MIEQIMHCDVVDCKESVVVGPAMTHWSEWEQVEPTRDPSTWKKILTYVRSIRGG